MKSLWDKIVKHSVWSNVVAIIIAAAMLAIISFIYSYIKSISFFSSLISILNYKLSISIYILITLGILIIFRLFRRLLKPRTYQREFFKDNFLGKIKTQSEPEVEAIKISKNLIFDIKIADEKTFTGYGQKIWDAPARKLAGVDGSGVFEFKDKILTIIRTNREGRFIIPITKYFFNGEATSFVPKNTYGKNPRNFQVTYQARSISGIHRIVFVFRKKEGYDWINSTTIIVREKPWTNQSASYSINSDEDFVMELHTYLESKPPATLQIKDLHVEET